MFWIISSVRRVYRLQEQGDVCLVSWMAMTEDSQSSDGGFDSPTRYCDYRTMASSADCGSAHPSSILGSHLLGLIIYYAQ